MTRERGIQLGQAAAYLLFPVIWRYGPPLGGTEFSGGRITGPILTMNDVGVVLSVIALLLVFFLRRTSAVIGMLAAALSLPLFVYFVAPGPFRWMFKNEYWVVPLTSDLVWNTWSIVGIAAVMVASYFSVWSLLFSGRRKQQKSS